MLQASDMKTPSVSPARGSVQSSTSVQPLPMVQVGRPSVLEALEVSLVKRVCRRSLGLILRVCRLS